MKSFLTVIAGAVLAILLVISFGIDWRNVTAGGTIDFRNRLTGARVLQHHHDAYHYKWQLTDPEEWCDLYNNPALDITKVTVTPTLLVVNFPLAVLPYRPAQFIWLITQWLLLLGTGWLWFKPIPSMRLRWLWVAAVVGFTYTVAWRHHADRGQAYVLILFLLACWTRISLRPKLDTNIWVNLLVGLVAGLLVALRPPLALLLGPLLLLRRRGQIAGAVMGLALSAGLPLLWSSSCWSDYQSGMQSWSEHYRAGTLHPRPPPQRFPIEIEDIPINVLGHFSPNIPFADSSIFALMRTWGIPHTPALPVTLALVLLVALWFWFVRSQPDEAWLAGVVAWSFLIDLFLPAYRNSYTDVMILNVVALALIMRHRNRWLAGSLLAAWPAGWAINAMGVLVGSTGLAATWPAFREICVMLLRTQWFINLPTWIMVAGSLGLLLQPWLVKPKPAPAALT